MSLPAGFEDTKDLSLNLPDGDNFSVKRKGLPSGGLRSELGGKKKK